MEANAGGTLIYIRNYLSYKARNGLKIYKSLNQSLHLLRFVILRNKYYYWIIYKHPNININEFKDDYLNEILDKLSKK